MRSASRVWRDQPMPGSAGAIIGRMERLPFTLWHGRVLGVVGLAHLFDCFDALLIAFVAPVLGHVWQLSPVDVGVLFSLGYVGQVIGAAAGGPIGDRFGRRGALRASLFILALLSIACAAAPGFGALAFFRLVQGIGLGAELPLAVTYMNEVSPAASRGRIIFGLQCIFTGGAFVAALGSAWLVPVLGWRAMFLFGGMPLLLALALPQLVPESPRWLAAAGRLAPAEAIVARMEASVRGPLPAFMVQQPAAGPAGSAASAFRQLLAPRYIGRTLPLWLMMFAASLMGMSITTWLPTLYTGVYHLSLGQALRFTSLTASGGMIGSVLGLVIIDRAGRRFTFLLGFAGAALALLVLGVKGALAAPMLVVALATTGMTMTSLLLCCGAVYAAEIYPTPVRATGVGATTATLRLGSVVAPLVVGGLLSSVGVGSVFIFFGVCGAAGTAVTFLFVTETQGRPLEEDQPAAALAAPLAAGCGMNGNAEGLDA